MVKTRNGGATPTILGIGLGVFLGHLIKVGYEYLTKEIQNIKTQEKQSTTNFKKVGVEKKEVEKISSKVDRFEKNAFIKSAFCGFINSSKFDPSMRYSISLEGDEIDSKNYDLIRVREVIDSKNRKKIEFLLEIPNNLKGFSLGDYIRCIDRASQYMWENFKINSLKPKCSLVGFIGYSRIDPDNLNNRIAETVQLTSEFTEPYKSPNSKHDGLSDFCKLYYERLYDSDYTNGNGGVDPTDDLLEFLGLDESDDVRIFETFMAYKIPFPEKFFSRKDEQFFGISVAKVLECLDYLLNSFRIFKFEDEKEFNFKVNEYDLIENYRTYDCVMFQALNDNNESDLNYYYVTDNEGNIKTVSYAYDAEDEDNE